MGILLLDAGSLDEMGLFGSRPAPPVAGHRAVRLDRSDAAEVCTLAVELGDGHIMSVTHSAGGCVRMAELAVRTLAA